MKNKIAIVRGKFLTKYDMEPFEHLSNSYNFTAFGSLADINEDIKFPIVKQFSPMDLPNFPLKMQLLNRLFIDAHYLLGLENGLRNFDIAHTSETYFNYTRQCLNAKNKGYVKKVVITVLENIAFNNEGIWGRKKFKQRALAEADYLIAATNKARDSLILEGADSGKISVIGLGVNTDKFHPLEVSKINSQDLNVLFVGRIERYKGIFDLIKAFSEVAKTNLEKKIRLTIVGKGSKENEMHKEIKKLGIGKIVNHITLPYHSLPDEYRKASIFVGPSKESNTWKEQFGMVFAEAMASGIPVITTHSGSIEEVVKKTAIFINPGDIKELKLHIELLLNNPEKRNYYSKLGRERAVTKLSHKVIAKEIDSIYQKIL